MSRSLNWLFFESLNSMLFYKRYIITKGTAQGDNVTFLRFLKQCRTSDLNNNLRIPGALAAHKLLPILIVTWNNLYCHVYPQLYFLILLYSCMTQFLLNSSTSFLLSSYVLKGT